MADNYKPLYDNPYANKIDENQFNNWRGQYYGNNDYGYRPQQNRLSDLLYPQQRFSYTNNDFQRQAPLQNYQTTQQHEYQQPTQQNFRPSGGNANYYIEHNGNLIPATDYVRMENERTQGRRYEY